MSSIVKIETIIDPNTDFVGILTVAESGNCYLRYINPFETGCDGDLTDDACDRIEVRARKLIKSHNRYATQKGRSDVWTLQMS